MKIKNIRNIQKGIRIVKKLYLNQEKLQKAVGSIKKCFKGEEKDGNSKTV